MQRMCRHGIERPAQTADHIIPIGEAPEPCLIRPTCKPCACLAITRKPIPAMGALVTVAIYAMPRNRSAPAAMFWRRLQLLSLGAQSYPLEACRVIRRRTIYHRPTNIGARFSAKARAAAL